MIVTYYWPPSGGSGVQRWLKFTRYLEEMGWHAVVVTPENPQFDTRDASLLQEVHPNTEVLHIPIWEPYHLVDRLKGNTRVHQGSTSKSTSSWMKTIRGNVTLPDPRIFWKKPVLRFLKEYLKTRHIDAIITTGPPHSMHLIGRKVHRKYKTPWIADFRDPWSTWDMLDEFNTSSFARSVHQRMEASVVKEAESVVTVSPTWARELQERYKKTIRVITNGYDPEDFPQEQKPVLNKFRWMHFGLINEFRHAPTLWQAFAELLQEIPEMKQDLEISLYGVMDDQLQGYFANDCPVREYLNIHKPISHEEVLRKYYEAFTLLLFMNRSENATGHIPGKVFEYLATGTPILAVGNTKGDTASILTECKAGNTFEWSDLQGMKAQIRELYTQFKTGKQNHERAAVAQTYSRPQLTAQLVELLNTITNSDGSSI